MAKRSRQPSLPGMSDQPTLPGMGEVPSEPSTSQAGDQETAHDSEASDQVPAAGIQPASAKGQAAAQAVATKKQPTPTKRPAASQAAAPCQTDPSADKSATSGETPRVKPGKQDAGPNDASSGLDATSSLKDRVIYAIDGNNLIFQVFHGLPEMTSPRGEPVNAVFGFLRDLLMLIEVKQPDYLLCAMDPPGGTFRHSLYPQYKANRSEMPDDLRPQFSIIRQMLATLGVSVVEVPGYEADDVLASIADMAERQQAECYLVTSDKDCRQLISDRVHLYNIRKDQLYTAQQLQNDWGVRPNQVVDFQALVGDSTDNVPGVRMIGPKAARELLESYDTLESVLENAHEVRGAKRQENLIAGRESALLSRQLVELKRDVPLDINWDAARVGGYHVDAMLDLCGELGFHRLADQVRALEGRAAPEPWKCEYHLVNTPEALSELVAQLETQHTISLDTETTSVNPREAKPCGLSFAWEPGEAWYVAVRARPDETALPLESTLEALREVLCNPAIKKIGQNLKYDLVVLRSAGIQVQGVAFDTMLASYLLDAGERIHNLDELAKRYLNHTTVKISELIGTGKNQRRMDEVPLELVAPYACEDADVPLRLMPILEARLKEDGLESLFYELEMPLVEVLAEMEFHGIAVDRDRLAELSETYRLRLEILEQEIFELAGREFNIASPKQLQQVLFEEQGLPIGKRTKTGPSTDVTVLEELAAQHPLPAKIIEFRQFAKLKNTYVDALPLMIHPETGRVHASFNQSVAATGRLSSSDPNLQNIPIRTESGREIRSAFRASPEGWVLLAGDYSQIELRVLAHFSEDQELCRAFQSDEDIHRLVASQVYDVPLGEVTSQQRRAAKAVNFGVIYGQTGFGLARSLGIELDDATEFIDNYFERYSSVEDFLSNVLEGCLKRGYVTTIMGRRRAIRGVRSNPSRRQRNLPERTAINTVIQGSAADLIKRAMICVHRRLQDEGLPARMLLQIHDELVFEVPADTVELLAALVNEEMTSVLPLRVPLKVDLKSGPTWADTEPWG
jgi:DNA polymerase-1